VRIWRYARAHFLIESVNPPETLRCTKSVLRSSKLPCLSNTTSDKEHNISNLVQLHSACSNPLGLRCHPMKPEVSPMASRPSGLWCERRGEGRCKNRRRCIFIGAALVIASSEVIIIFRELPVISYKDFASWRGNSD